MSTSTDSLKKKKEKKTPQCYITLLFSRSLILHEALRLPAWERGPMDALGAGGNGGRQYVVRSGP